MTNGGYGDLINEIKIIKTKANRDRYERNYWLIMFDFLPDKVLFLASS